VTVVATITSDGEALGLDMTVKSIDIAVEVDRIPDATLVLLDGSLAERSFPLLYGGQFAPGKTIGIALREDDGPGTTVFEGLPVRASLRIVDGHPELVVELRGTAAKMTRVRRSRVFQEMADAFRELISASSLPAGTIDDTGATHPELVQYRVTDWDFMVARAQALGLSVTAAAVGTEVSVRLPDLSAAAEITLDLGIDAVIDLELEADGLGQPNGVEASAWDPAAQEAQAPAEAAEFNLEQGATTPGDAAGALSDDPKSISHMAPGLPDELSGWADGTLRRARLGFLRGRVALRGNGAPAPLQLVELSGMGDRFNGKALIGGVRHRVDRDGWRTEIALGLGGPRLIERPDVVELPAGGLIPAARAPGRHHRGVRGRPGR